MTKGDKVRDSLRNGFKLKLFMLQKLPMALLAGLKILHIDKISASASVPYKYLNKNPFGSMYFGVLSMAAELPTGVLAMAAVSDAEVPVSLLVLGMKAEFLKKAKTKIVFTCNDGLKISEAVSECIKTGESKTVEAFSKGEDTEGNVVAEFRITWTFKPKNKQ